jgi:hypothetical protein
MIADIDQQQLEAEDGDLNRRSACVRFGQKRVPPFI